MILIPPTIFCSPMAYAIMGGLAIATVLALVFLPALYLVWLGIKRPQDRHASEATCPSILLSS
jgi:Cu/Ag efflux pump CusA